DGGKNWTKTHDTELRNLSVIGWYFMDIYVNPQNDDDIYALGVRLANSKDGGKTFSYLGGNIRHLNESPAQTLHLDHCEMWINPINPNHLILGNDGGLYVTFNQGLDWTHYNNIPTGEFYDINFDQQTPYRIYGGVQDDATVFGPATEWKQEYDDDWEYLWIDAWSGGDGCMTFIDPRDHNTVYFSMQHAAVRRKDMAADTSVSIRPSLPPDHEGELKSNFITPYLLSDHNPDVLYLAANYIFKSTDQGDNWEVISDDLSGKSEKNGNVAAGSIVESPLRKGLLYVGMDRGSFWLSTDDGDSWIERSDGLSNGYIRGIAPSRYNTSRIYISITGINYDDLNAYVYVTENNGKKWTSIRGNLPNQVINTIVEDPFYEDVLYLGTLRGVYFSLDRGDNWKYLGAGLPDVSVADLQIEPNTKDLIAATHGRGIYKMNLAPLYTYLENGQEQIFQIPTAYLPKKVDTHGDYDRKTHRKVPITFWIEGPDNVNLEIRNESDSLIWDYKYAATAGFNEIRWNLITESVQSDYPYFIHYDKFIEPGSYQVLLKCSSGILEEQLTVRSFPLFRN
ncbi:MAG: hypothetical protein MI865_03550, partial [Proteobacteria bacterium]|nr:hypothetical protein [Pseudomonadota bacterium]